MRLLIDTHAFLWWRADSPKLAAEARRALLDDANEVLVSSAVAWEIVIKRALGRLDFDGAVAAAIADEGFFNLAVTAAHVDEGARLPLHHRDPFDRLIIAQARIESLTLMTRDPRIRAYDGFAVLLA